MPRKPDGPAVTASEIKIRVLSAGAPKGGVSGCAEAYREETGVAVEITFATAPVLRDTVVQGRAEADVVVAPLAGMKQFKEAGLIRAEPEVVVGSVKAGVAVRSGAPEPDLSSVESFKEALIAADSVVYNQASSGLYIARMIEDLGLAAALEDKTVRLPTGAAVFTHLAESISPAEIGFGQIPEIRRFADQGVTLVGPLPEAIGKTTTYAAGILTGAQAPGPVEALLAFMATPRARDIFIAAGLEQQ